MYRNDARFIARKLEKSRFISNLDIDGTIALTKPPTADAENFAEAGERWTREVYARENIIRICRSYGVVGAIGMRTGVLMMSKEEYESTNRYYEHPPKIGINPDGSRFPMWPDESLEHTHLFGSFDYIVPVGCGVLIKYGTGYGYAVDHEFQEYIGHSKDWRKHAFTLVEDLALWAELEQPHVIAPVCIDGNYEKGIVDVGPPPLYRLEIKFCSLRDKQIFMKSFEQMKCQSDTLARFHFVQSVEIMDESRVNPSNPSDDRFQIYLVPSIATKSNSFDYLLEELCVTAGIPTKSVRVLLAGDSMTDLMLGCYGGLDATITFLLASDRLSSCITNPECTTFAGDDITDITRHLKSESSMPNGFYILEGHKGSRRRVVVLHDLYPYLTGPESMSAFLTEYSEEKTFLS